MLAVILILLLTIFVVFFIPNYQEETDEDDEPTIRKTPQMKKLWSLAQTAMKERKPLKAEKALLTILKFDEKNAAAYNRLGILYAREKHFKEAIECFEIAQSLEPSASSLHNVGLIYYETGHYDKASLAFEQALSMEDTLAARHIAYAKVQEKLGHTKRMIASLERAVEIDPSIQSYKILADAYARAGEQEKADTLNNRINRALASKNPPAKTVQQVRKVVM